MSMIMEKIKSDPAAQILLAVFLSALIFIPIGSSGLKADPNIVWLSVNVFETIGSMFMNALKMLIIPLVLLGLMTGVSGLSDVSKMKRMASWTVGLYLLSTVIAITQGVSLALLFDYFIGFGSNASTAGLTAPVVDGSGGGIKNMLLSIIPTNIISAMAEGNMLALIFVAITFGVGIATATPKYAKSVNEGAVSLNDIVLNVVGLVMKFAPIGIFALMANIFISNGVDTLIPLIGYVGVLFTALMIHMFVTYNIIIRTFSSLKPSIFYAKMKEIWLFGFSTASSSATIPVSLRVLEKKMGVHSSVCSFTVPLGATINMDGTAIMQGVATIFIASMYGVPLDLAAIGTVVVTATTASIGTASVRSAGTIMLAMIFAEVGLPPEGIMLILAVDPILDMIRTAVNLTGDAAVSLVVAEKENAIDMEIYNKPVEAFEKEQEVS